MCVINMAFVDPLAVMLLAAGASAAIIALYFIMVVKQKKNIQGLAVPMLMLGIFNAVSGFIMSFGWPLPGAYNILFGDPILFLGIIMVSAAIMIFKNMDFKVLSVLGFLLGIYVLIEAFGIISIPGLETGLDKVLAVGFYVFAGLSALLSPMIYLNPKTQRGKYAYCLLAALLILTALAALVIGYGAVYSHLLAPP